MRSLGCIFRQNVPHKCLPLYTSSITLRLCFLFNVFAVVLCWYTNALYLDDSVSVVVNCGDPQCKEVISLAETQINYGSNDARILSFKAGQKVSVYAKPAYSQFKLIFGEINGKKGFIPLNLIRETKVLKKSLQPVVLPKGISNVIEDNSDKNSDKSTAAAYPTVESLGLSQNVSRENSDKKSEDVKTSVSAESDSNANKTDVDATSGKVENEVLKETKDLKRDHNQDGQQTSGDVDANHDLNNSVTSKYEQSPSKTSEVLNRSMLAESQPPVSSNTNETGVNAALENKENENFEEKKDSKDDNQKSHQFSGGVDNDLNASVPSQDEHVPNKTSDALNGSILAGSQSKVTANTNKTDVNVTSGKVENEDVEKNKDSKDDHNQGGKPISGDVENDLNISVPSQDEHMSNKTIDAVNGGFSAESEPTVSTNTDEIGVDRGTEKIENDNRGENNYSKDDHNQDGQSSLNVDKSPNLNTSRPSENEYMPNKTSDAANESISAESQSKVISNINKTDINATSEAVENVEEKKDVKDDRNQDGQQSSGDVDENHHLNNSGPSKDEHSPYKTSDAVNASTLAESQSNVISNINKTDINATSGEVENVEEKKDVKDDHNQDGHQSLVEASKQSDVNTSIASEVEKDFSNVDMSINSSRRSEDSSKIDVEEPESELDSYSSSASNSEPVLGSELEVIEHKNNLTSVETESVITEKMVAVDTPDVMHPEKILESSSFQNSYEESTASTSILFTIIPKDYIDILRIYVTILADMLPDNIKLILSRLRISSHVVVFTFLCGILWLTMYFLGTLFNLFSKDSALRAELCDFQLKFFKLKNERDSLQRLLQSEEEKCFEFDEKISEKEHRIMSLERELDRLKKERVELRDKILALETDVTSATNTGLELNAVLSDFLTSQKENVSLNTKVDSLQQQITKQEEFISQLRKSYRLMEEENAELKHLREKSASELERLTRLLDDTDSNLRKYQVNNEAIKSSNNEMLQQIKELEESKTSLVYELRKLEEEKEERDILTTKLEDEVISLKSNFEAKESEVKSLQEVIRSLKEDTEDNVDDLFDVAKIKTELDVVLKEKSEIQAKYESVTSEREKILETLKSLEESNVKFKESEEKAIKEKVDAQNNLEILKNYFTTKEIELQQKVGLLQVSKQQREEDADSLMGRLKFLEEENSAYKSQLDTMRNELIDSDKNWKSQLAKMEKKAHDNWVAARNAHRQLEELKSDSAALRQNLSLKAKSTVDGNSSIDDDEPVTLSNFMPPPPPFSSFGMSFEDKGDGKRWEGIPNFMSLPPPPPMPPFGVDFENMPPMPPSFAPLPSHHQSLPFTNHSMGNHPIQWDSPSSRDAFSPVSQQSHERRSSRGNSPMHSTMSSMSAASSMRGVNRSSNFQELNSHQPYAGSAHFTNAPPHWIRPNGNLTNNAVNTQNHEKKKSRSDSRNSVSTGRLHASNV